MLFANDSGRLAPWSIGADVSCRTLQAIGSHVPGVNPKGETASPLTIAVWQLVGGSLYLLGPTLLRYLL